MGEGEDDSREEVAAVEAEEKDAEVDSEEDIDRHERRLLAEARPIVRLEENVVNRIAAGEIIHRPANALKELIENSLDAGATLIKITLKEGGLKSLQIQDNGCGVKASDLPLLCERFATSKLRDFSDLSRMTTFGFRGEALASISYVSAAMTVTSKTRDSDCAYRASYAEGSLVAPKAGQSASPKPCAGTDGTQILAEDLFYNVPQRRRALKGSAEEYNRCLDVASRYAVHYGGRGVGFVCKKASSNVTDLSTPASDAATTLETIRLLHGSSVARELVRLKPQRVSSLGFSVEGWLSGANYSTKRTTFLLFINHRLVDCAPLKRSFEALYSSLLPKGGHPWIYLSLEIDTEKVDVNVHPTKREVRFLDEDDIIESVCELAESCLAGANSSRNFQLTQAILPGATMPQSRIDGPRALAMSKSSGYPQHTVRVDARMQTLDSMGTFTPNPSERQPALASSSQDPSNDSQSNQTQPSATARRKIGESDCTLASVKKMRDRIKKDRHEGLTEVFQNHTFVGVVDAAKSLSLLQHRKELYIFDHAHVIEDFAYQLTIRQFGNLARIRLSPPPSLADLLRTALLIEADRPQPGRGDLSDDDIIARVSEKLTSRADMLQEYFSIQVDAESQTLETLPALIPGHSTIVLERVPTFVLRLGSEVDWESERPCFEGIARELALLHVPSFDDDGQDDDDDNDTQKGVEGPVDKDAGAGNRSNSMEADQAKVSKVLTQAWLPSMRCYQPRKDLLANRAVVQVASLPSLYSVFERC